MITAAELKVANDAHEAWLASVRARAAELANRTANGAASVGTTAPPAASAVPPVATPPAVSPLPPAQGILNFNAPLPASPAPVQGNLNLGPPQPLARSFTPVPSNAAGIARVQAIQRASRVANGLPSVISGTVPPPAVATPVPPAQAVSPSIASRLSSGVNTGKSMIGTAGRLVVPAVLGAQAVNYATDENARAIPIARYGDPVAEVAGPAAGAIAAGVGGAGEEVANLMTGGGLRQGLENQKTGKYNVVEGGNITGDLVNNTANVLGGVGDAILSIPGSIRSFFGGGESAPKPISNPVPTSTPQTPGERIAADIKALREQNYINNLPPGGEPIKGTTAFYKTSYDPTGNDNRQLANVPGKGIASIQGLPGQIAGPMRESRTGQIFVGSSTDAEAARNLQARAEQDQAAQAEVTRLNRATEAVRSLNEARNPRFQFGASSIGGGPDTLDVASGRVITADTPASVVADKMRSLIESAGPGHRKSADQAASLIGQGYLEQLAGRDKLAQTNAAKGTGIDPLDAQRYLLDQGKFNWQQGVDTSKLTLDALKAKAEQETAGRRANIEESAQTLKQREYDDKRTKDFLTNFFLDKNASPQLTAQIGAEVLKASDATKGAVSPEALTARIQQLAADPKNAIDWKNRAPSNIPSLVEQALISLKQERQ